MHRPVSVLALDREANHRYAALFDGGNELMTRAHSLNDDLLRFKIPTVRIWSAKKRLRQSLLPRVTTLHDDYAEWEIQATNFLLSPELYKVPAQDEIIYVSHLLGSLRDQIQRTTEEVNVTKGSYASRDQQLNTQEVRILTVVALLLSSLSLLLSALSFLLSPTSISIFF